MIGQIFWWTRTKNIVLRDFLCDVDATNEFDCLPPGKYNPQVRLSYRKICFVLAGMRNETAHDSQKIISARQVPFDEKAATEIRSCRVELVWKKRRACSVYEPIVIPVRLAPFFTFEVLRVRRSFTEGYSDHRFPFKLFKTFSLRWRSGHASSLAQFSSKNTGNQNTTTPCA